MESKNLYLKPEEAKFLGMAVVSMIEQIQISNNKKDYPWNPEARKTFKDMLAAGTALKIKMEKLGFDVRALPPYVDGDENEFFTKLS